jgi:serine/threonine protein kinase/tetratricopeptide (TPR) repeat protein
MLLGVMTRKAPLQPADWIGPYRLEEPLGSGGMGMVWRAWDDRLRRAVALKRFLAEDAGVSNLRARFLHEAQAVARLNHPAIVHIYDIVAQEDGEWIVMELVEGRTLGALLGERGPFAIRRAAQIGREIAEGLAEAHAQGVLHRDLKASNVMVTSAGRVKILDFGLAKDLDVRDGAAFPDPLLSTPGTIIGTCHTMSPEQVQGLPLDARSDLFSLGSLLYELLTGKAPFLAESATASLGRVVGFHPPPLDEVRPEIPEFLASLVTQLLAKERQQRPPGAREVADLLEGMLTGALAGLEERPGIPEGAGSTGGAGGAGGFRLTGSLFSSTEADQRPTLSLGPPPSQRERQRSLGERRTVTVVCCGLAGASEASGEETALELEDLTETMSVLQDLATEVALRFGGRPGGTLGNRLWLYFGHPQAHEDDPRHGVLAARALAARAAELGLRFGRGQRPVLRLAVHTGAAVAVGRLGTAEQLQPGETLDLAAGLQSVAPAGGVVVSAACHRLIAASFATEELPPVHLPGRSAPVSLFRVVEATQPSGRTRREVLPLVGREKELALVVDRFLLASTGAGQMVMISGEPGIGKSRLVQAVRERLREQGMDFRWLASYGSAPTQSSPLAAVSDLLAAALFPGTDEAEEPAADHGVDRLAEVLAGLGLEETLPLFASLLSLPADGPAALPDLAPDVLRRKTLEAVVALFAEMAERQPVALVCEDLHWADASTLELLGLLLDSIAALPLVLLVTFRPELVPPWGHRAQTVQLGLTRLTDAETADLIDRVAGERLGTGARQQIIARTDGVPLFIEELTKTVVEAGASNPVEIPLTLNGSLIARLDRLGEAKEVAQVASVIGRKFSLDLLAAVSSLPPDVLRQGLDQLLQAELIYRRGLAHRERYLFKHALIQDAAYASLLHRDRRELHREIARLLTESPPEPDGARPEAIARHYTAGEDFARAAGSWLDAGRQASARCAQVEAIEHLQQGLLALERLPPGRDRDRSELDLQTALGPPLAMTHGHAAPEVEATYARILTLGERVGQTPEGIYFGLWNIYASRGELRRARELAEQRIRGAEEGQDVEGLILGLYTQASSELYLGNLDVARAAFERLLRIYPAIAVGTSNDYDIRTTSLASLGDALWLAGLPETGTRRCDEAVDLARKLSPRALSVALLIRMILATSMRDAEVGLACAHELLALSREYSYELWTVFCDLSTALLGTAAGAPPAAVDQALETAVRAVETMRSVHGNRLQQSRYLAWVAEFCCEHGCVERGEEILAQGFLQLETTDERYWEPELHRLRGRLLGERDAPAAEAALERALALARERGMRTLELRAALDLCRLRDRQGRRAEGCRLLRGVYDSFREGWSTPDLVQAGELLAGLGDSAGMDGTDGTTA